MSTKEALKTAVEQAKSNLAEAEIALEAFDGLPENNTFKDMDEAEQTLEDRLRDKAFADCEGAHKCGLDKYEQEFIVDGVRYIGTLNVEYNRHDKTYYYIDDAVFSYKAVEA